MSSDSVRWFVAENNISIEEACQYSLCFDSETVEQCQLSNERWEEIDKLLHSGVDRRYSLQDLNDFLEDVSSYLADEDYFDSIYSGWA